MKLGRGGGWESRAWHQVSFPWIYITAVFPWGKLFLRLLCLHWPLLKGECSNRCSVGIHSAIILLYWWCVRAVFFESHIIMSCYAEGRVLVLSFVYCDVSEWSGLAYCLCMEFGVLNIIKVWLGTYFGNGIVFSHTLMINHCRVHRARSKH